MRITEIRIEGYGAIANLTIPVEKGLVCLYGPNEAGKSTLIAFVRSILFGFSKALTSSGGPDQGRKVPFDPVNTASKGGSLTVVTEETNGNERKYRFERTKVAKAEGDLLVHDFEAKKVWKGEDAERLKEQLLGDADSTLFSNVFALGPAELHDVASLDQDAVKSVLFTADAGVGADLVREMERIREAKHEIYLYRGKKNRIALLNEEIRNVEKTLREAQDDYARYQPDRERLAELKRLRDGLAVERSQLYKSKEATSTRTRARILHAELGRLQEEHDGLASRLLPSPEDHRAAEKLRTRIETDGKELEKQESELKRLQTKHGDIEFNEIDAKQWTRLKPIQTPDLDLLVAAQMRTESLRALIDGHDRPYISAVEEERFVELRNDRTRALGEREKNAQALADAKREVEQDEGSLLQPDAELAAKNANREPIGEIRRAFESAETHGRTEKDAAARAIATLGPDWSLQRLKAVPTDLVFHTQIAAQLPLEPRVGGARTPSSLVWSLWLVSVGLGSAALVGLLGFFEWFPALLMLVAGALTAVLAVRARLAGRVPSGTSLPDDVRRALEQFGFRGLVGRGDFERVAAQLRAAADASSKSDDASLRVTEAQERLDAASEVIRRAATLVDLQTEGTNLAIVQDEVGRRLETSKAASARLVLAKETYRRRSKALEDSQKRCDDLQGDLKELMTLKKCAGHEGELRFQEYAVESRQLDEQKRELASLEVQARRFSAVYEEISSIQKARHEPVPKLDHFAHAFRDASQTCEKASESQKEAGALAIRIRDSTAAVHQRKDELENAKKQLVDTLKRYGCPDFLAFDAASDSWVRRKELETRLRDKKGDLGNIQAAYSQVLEDLARLSASDDAEILATFESKQGDLDSRRNQIEDEEKQVFARLEARDSSDKIGDSLALLSSLHSEKDQAVQEWLELVLTEYLLTAARESFEREHGPKVLQRASEFLKTITNGRYEHVVRSSTEEGYEVVRAGGRRLPAKPPEISAGTFAQVYLCIRLAYTDVMSPHRKIPYVLDDVLTDFDDYRMSRGLQVLSELAKSRQVVIMSHHERVRDGVKALKGSVYSLPMTN